MCVYIILYIIFITTIKVDYHNNISSYYYSNTYLVPLCIQKIHLILVFICLPRCKKK